MVDICKKVRISIEPGSETKTNEKQDNFYDLSVTYDNYKKLLTWSKQLNLFSDSELNHIQEIKIQKRCQCFQILLEKIQEKIKTINTTVSDKIKTIFENILTNLVLSDGSNLTEYIDKVEPEKHLDIREIKMSGKLCPAKSAVPVYPMRTKNRGVLFFVNIRQFPQHSYMYRSGSEYDKFYLISLFRKFGYKIYYYEDLVLDTFWDLVNCLIKSHLNDTESLIFVVASHGNEEQEIEFYHGEKTNISNILFKFSNLNCPTMEGKPKIFIFPCCRGQIQDYGISSIESDGEIISQRAYSDILICYATIHGFVTNRDVNFGSWYIEAFYRVLAQKAFELDLESMLYLVADTVKNICDECVQIKKKSDPDYKAIFQTPSCVRWDFNKLLFFNPGYVDDG